MKISIISTINNQDVQNNFECDEYKLTENALILKKSSIDIAYIATRAVKMILIDPIALDETVPQVQSEAPAD